MVMHAALMVGTAAAVVLPVMMAFALMAMMMM